jgi:class 3 adenylate cyclase/signal transduction histidine kinase
MKRAMTRASAEAPVGAHGDGAGCGSGAGTTATAARGRAIGAEPLPPPPAAFGAACDARRGEWDAPLELREGGSYMSYASTSEHDGSATTDATGVSHAAGAVALPAVRFSVRRWGASYVLCTALTCVALHGRGDAGVTAAVGALPPVLHLVSSAAFFVQASVNAVPLLMHRGSRLGWCAALNAYVGLLTGITNLLHAATPGVAPALRTCWGAAILPMRYVSWMHTTPALIALMAALCCVRRPHQYTLAVTADVVMLVTGLIGSVVASRLLAALLMVVSTAAMYLVLLLVWRWFTDAIAASPPGSVQRATLRFCRVHTLVAWHTFPAIVAYEALCAARGDSALAPAVLWRLEAAHAVGDFAAKVVWASLLVQGNALVSESHSRVSRRYLADSAQDELVSRLRVALTLRDRLLSATSHELRTPLNSIVGLADKLLSNAQQTSLSGGGAVGVAAGAPAAGSSFGASAAPNMPPSPRVSQLGSPTGGPAPRLSMSVAALGGGQEVTRALAAIKTSGIRLLALVDDLADDASLAASRRVTLSCAPVDLEPCVTEVLALHEGLQSTGVRLINGVPRGLPPVLADRARIAAVLHKLLAAAVRDTHAGAITISAEAVVDGCDEGGDVGGAVLGGAAGPWDPTGAAGTSQMVDANGSFCHVPGATASGMLRTLTSVQPPRTASASSGGGADADAAPRAAAANMVALTVTDTGSGTAPPCDTRDASDAEVLEDLGLGLHGARELVEAHGGRMHVHARPGMGTSVRITLPLAHDPFARASLDGGYSSAGSERRGSSDGACSRRSLDRERAGGGGAGTGSVVSEHRSSNAGSAGRRSVDVRRTSMSLDVPGFGSAFAAPPGALGISGAMPPPRRSSPPPAYERVAAAMAANEAQQRAAADAAARQRSATLDAHPAQEEWLTLSGGSAPPVVLCVGGVGGQAHLAELLATGFTVRAARDADAALLQLAADTQGPSAQRRCWPDVILLDVSSGLSAINRFHEACPASTPPPPVIVLLPSGAADNGHAERCMSAGAAEIMRFPLARDLLHARIHTQLRLRSTLHEARTSMALLRRMLPDGVISRLKDGQSLIAESMDSVTVLFSDVVSFTSLASEVPTTDLIIMLNELFSAFDVLCDKHHCYKVETIGDAYMVVAGQDGAPDHAVRMLALAADMLAAAERIRLPRVSCRTLCDNPYLSLPHEAPAHNTSPHIRLRIGMHSGPAFAGVVGTKMPRFSFFGDTINTASRMESTGFPMAVQLSEATHAEALVQGAPADKFVPFGERAVKGKGMMRTFLVREGAWEEALAAQELTPTEEQAAWRCSVMRRSSSHGQLARTWPRP